MALPKGYTHTASMDSHNAHASLDSVIRQQATLDSKYEQSIKVETISNSEKEEEVAYNRNKKHLGFAPENLVQVCKMSCGVYVSGSICMSRGESDMSCCPTVYAWIL